MIRAVRPEYQFIRNMQLVEGRWISDDDNLQRNRVAVLGATVAKELFSGIPPVGEDITLRGQRFTVIGVLDTKGQIANYNRPDNECVFMPYDTMALFGDLRHPSMIVWTPVNGLARNDAVRAVRATLAARHRFCPQRREGHLHPGVQPVHVDHRRHVAGGEAPAGLRGNADAGHRRRGPGQHHAGRGDRPHARDRRAESAGRSPARRSWGSSSSRGC